jgi:microcin C transport system permease protein
MKIYVIKRLLLLPVSFFTLMCLLFLLTRSLPGGPLDRALSRDLVQSSKEIPVAMERLSSDQLQQLREYYGLDQNFWGAFTNWIQSLFHGDLGLSLRYQEPVLHLIAERLPTSFIFGFASLFLAYGICVPLALFLAYHTGRKISHFVQGCLWVASAVPSFVWAGLFFLIFAAELGWFPLGGLPSSHPAEKSWYQSMGDTLHHIALPLGAYLVGQLGALTLLLKTQLEEAYASECIRLARSKGASRWQALRRDAWPLSRLPLIASLAQQLGWFLAGSLLIERIFNIDGMGLFAYEALVERDYPIVLGFLAILSLLHLLGQFVSDLALAWLDPRVRWGDHG